MTVAALGSSLADLRAAAATLRAGGLVAFPTETVYGLGADASNPQAVAKIFAAKGRPADHPVIVHIASASQLPDWASEIPDVAWALADAFWPGPLTLILKRGPNTPLAVTGGQDTVGLMVPSHPVALELLNKFGGGLAAPSANRFGRVSPTTAAHVVEEFGDDIDYVIDGGACGVGLESTIVDLTGEHARLLRPGGLSREQLATVLGYEPQSPLVNATPADAPAPSVDVAPRAPGTLESHYAPHTKVVLVETPHLESSLATFQSRGVAVALLALGEAAVASAAARSDHRVRVLEMPAKAPDYAAALYSSLREADSWQRDVIVVERPPMTPAWEAVLDRLSRASA